jgi:hypothetical protein
MNPKEFLNKYPTCPKCGIDFRQSLMVFTDTMIEPCLVKSYAIKESELRISMDAPGYPSRLDYSINYSDGRIKLYNNTKWDDFSANEPMTLTLDFACENCGMYDHRGFYASFFGKTTPGHSFSFGRDLVYFQYVVEDILYAVQSSYEDGKTTLEIHQLNLGLHSKIELPIMELDLFDFSSKDRMKEKLTTIMLLA